MYMHQCLLQKITEGIQCTRECVCCWWMFDCRHSGWHLWMHFVSWCIWTWWYACHLYKQLVSIGINFDVMKNTTGINVLNVFKQYFNLSILTCHFIITEMNRLKQSRVRPGHNSSFEFKFGKIILWVKRDFSTRTCKGDDRS